MTQSLTTEDILDIAEYARIGLTDEEAVRMTDDLNSVIKGFDVMFGYDLEGVTPTFHPIGSLSNVMREDIETQSFTQDEALMNAPAVQDGSFLIPSILGDGGDK